MGFRNASTNEPATASTPGNDPLTSLFGLAKGFLLGGISQVEPHPWVSPKGLFGRFWQPL
jgi:hypothetical protein